MILCVAKSFSQNFSEFENARIEFKDGSIKYCYLVSSSPNYVFSYDHKKFEIRKIENIKIKDFSVFYEIKRDFRNAEKVTTLHDEGTLEYEREINTPINLKEVTRPVATEYQFFYGESPLFEAGYAGGGIRSYLESNKEAVKELNKFEFKRKLAVVSFGTFIGGFAFAAATGFEKKGEPVYDVFEDRYVKKRVINTNGIVGLALSVVSLITYGVSMKTSEANMRRAVEIYNSGIDINKFKAFGLKIEPSELKISAYW